jgi:hypothetical protein
VEFGVRLSSPCYVVVCRLMAVVLIDAARLLTPERLNIAGLINSTATTALTSSMIPR